MNRQNDLMIPKHVNLEELCFSLFTTEDIKKICVLEIVTPLILTPLGHPCVGGLYDRRLGPLSDKRGELCGTCNKNPYDCPGHFGYIELPLPVINPIFHKVIGSILKMSCLRCYKIQVPEDLRLKLTFKNKEMIYTDVIKAISEEINTKKGCLFCKEHMDKIQVLKNKIILVTRTRADRYETNEAPSVMSYKVGTLESQYINPTKCKEYLREIWKNEQDLIELLAPVIKDVKCDHPTDAFFFEVIPVPPPNVRPMNFVNDRIMENPQSQAYKSIIQNSILLKAIIVVVQKKGDEDCLASAQAKAAYTVARGSTPIEKLNNCWEELQNDVNGLLDKDSVRVAEGVGLKQIIEKKAGVIRMHMMGKRVNFAARSVITPDPNLNIDEIGVPEVFAKHLTYPVPVTSWNVAELRKLIMNGPAVHPGAVLVEMEDGSVKRVNPNNATQQESLLKVLLTADDKDKGFRGVKMVHRHLMNGDVLLLNRQPTLHKPSIMAHTARILKGDKTLRLHYANCKAYNADFDGDEMNAHFPQNELARSEGYHVANVANQYLVPKDGTPLSGLIQDHMIAGVKMSLRGRFFDRNDYQQLVFQALSFKTNEIRVLPPAILKPRPLWSGKQILSTVIINIIPQGREAINLEATSKISAKAWQAETPRLWMAGGSPFKNVNTMSEAEVIIRGGELLVGILDKTHYGATPYGLVHCMYELYGGSYAIQLLSSFAKLFTRFLQQEGFTLGVHDILTLKYADKKRRRIVKSSRKIGKGVVTTALGLPAESSLQEIVEEIEAQSVTDPKIRQIIDRQYKTALDSFTNDINKTCLPAGLVCQFPSNNLQLMVQSGAKGSTVNTMQISCLLGQIELEGKRPPVMISGKSLPSFPAFEFAPRAGGFIDGRFMTGIQPQEFFFHCMAGREGLIDTAVKTSRSGYLQRCLIKHLEGLHVGYDMTVRNSDKKVIQFLYGEDGMDISKAQFLNEKQLKFLCENSKALVEKDTLKQLENSEGQEEVKEYCRKLAEWKEKFGDPLKQALKSPFSVFSSFANLKSTTTKHKPLKKKKIVKLWNEAGKEVQEDAKNRCLRCPDPVNSVFQSDHYFGSLNERLEGLVDGFETDKKTKKRFRNMMRLKSMRSLCAPGEPVGLLAAQSIGEPSTQMTLNTFHFAGRGEMNVTLGIPRLREILMMASKNIKTPSMEIPFLQVPRLEKRADALRKRLTRVTVADVLERIEVTVKLELQPARLHKYALQFHFLPEECYKSDYCVSPKSVMKHMQKVFFKEMFMAITKYSRIKSNLVAMEEEKQQKFRRTKEDDDDADEPKEKSQRPNREEDSSEDEIEDDEDAKMTSKFSQQREDQEPVEEEKEASDDDENGDEARPESSEKADQLEQSVVDAYSQATNYVQDKNNLWCQLTFSLPLTYKKLDLTAILKDVATKSVLWQTPNIKRAITYMKDDTLTLRTDGINIVELFQHHELLDLEKLYCNDIHKMAETYGIEAALKIIVKEVKDVFNVYGIKVDSRHLSLIADYMTFNGTFEPLSRKGMETSASPLQQMSFESSLSFLKAATIGGRHDDLQNPSSSLMVGKPCNTGTGCFTLLQKIPTFA